MKATSFTCDQCGKGVGEGDGGTPPGVHVVIAQHKIEQPPRSDYYEPLARSFVHPRQLDFCGWDCCRKWVDAQ